jgi:hypothetical protein
MKNGLSRSEQRTVSKTKNNRLTGKAPYKSCRSVLDDDRRKATPPMGVER